MCARLVFLNNPRRPFFLLNCLMNYSETYSLWINVSDNCATTAALVRFLLVPKMSKSPFPEWIILNELYHIFQDVTDQEKVSGRVRQLWLRVLVRRPQLQVGADSWSRHPRGQRRNLHPRLWPGKLLSQLIIPKATLSKGRFQKALSKGIIGNMPYDMQ